MVPYESYPRKIINKIMSVAPVTRAESDNTIFLYFLCDIVRSWFFPKSSTCFILGNGTQVGF